MQAEFVEYSELILDAETEAIGRVRGVLPGWMIESGIADADDDPYEVVALREKVLEDGDDTFRYYLMMRSLDDPETDPESFSHSIDLDREGWAALRLLCDRVVARLDHDAGVRHVETELAAVGGGREMSDEPVKVSNTKPLELREAIARAVFRGSLSPDPRNDRYLLEDSLFRDRHYETADAILAIPQIANALSDGPDLGDLLREAESLPGMGLDAEIHSLGGSTGYSAVLMDFNGVGAHGSGPTIEAAVQAALVAARGAAR